MRDKRTKITEEVFNRVRELQVVKRYPVEGVHRETGVSERSQRDIRRLKTWPAWTAWLDSKRKNKKLPEVVTPATITDEPSLVGKLSAKLQEGPRYALKDDLTKVAQAQMIDAGKLFDEVEVLKKSNKSLIKRTVRLVGQNRQLKNQLKDANLAGLADAIVKLNNAVFYPDGTNRIALLEQPVENLVALQRVINETPRIRKKLDKTAKRLAKGGQ